jgi:hypothetical protein
LPSLRPLGSAILLRLQAVGRQRADVVTFSTRARNHDSVLIKHKPLTVTVLEKKVAPEQGRIPTDGTEPIRAVFQAPQSYCNVGIEQGLE